MTSKIEIWGPKFVHFGRFEGSFLTILKSKKSFSRLFQICFGIVSEVFGLCVSY